MSAPDFVRIRAAIERDLKTNILPFSMTHTWDEVNGGFYGALTNDLRVLNAAPRSAVLCGRILWTFAAAYRLLHDPAYLATAQRAYAYIVEHFWDADSDGVYWAVDRQGRPMASGWGNATRRAAPARPHRPGCPPFVLSTSSKGDNRLPLARANCLRA